MLSGGLARREPCAACNQPVFLAQKLVVDRRVYHRTCFRCARCNAQLTLAGCYQTETDGQYCCETCPDEEYEYGVTDANLDSVDNTEESFYSPQIGNQVVMSEKILSDEEKLNDMSHIKTEPKQAPSYAFSGFINTQINQKDSDDDDVLPALPKSLPPSKHTEKAPEDNILNLTTPSLITNNEISKSPSVQVSDKSSDIISDNDKLLNTSDGVICEINVNVESVVTDDAEEIGIKQTNSESIVNINSNRASQLETASVPVDSGESDSGLCWQDDDVEERTVDAVAKDNVDNRESPNTSTADSSLVKMRMKIFEAMEQNNSAQGDTIVRKSKDDCKVIISNNYNNMNISKDNVSQISEETSPVVKLTDKEEVIESPGSNIEVPTDIVDVPLYESENSQNVDNLQSKSDIEKVDEIPKPNDDDSQDNKSVEEYVEDTESKINPVINDLSRSSDLVITNKSEEIHNDEIQVSDPTELEQNVKIETNNDGASVPNENVLTSELITEEKSVAIEENEMDDDYPEHLNPFSLSDDDDKSDSNKTSEKKEDSTNPFDCSDDEEVDANPKVNATVKKKSTEKPPRPPPPVFLLNANKANTLRSSNETRRVIPAPAISLNPFSSDEDENSGDENSSSIRSPIPTPRQSINNERSNLNSSSLHIEPRSFHGSSTSLASTISRRKKAPAPKPPNALDVPQPYPRNTSLQGSSDDLQNSSMMSLLSTPNTSLSHISPQVSPRSRKRRPAPRPPVVTVQPIPNMSITESPSYDPNLNSFTHQLIKDNVFCSSPIVQENKTDSSLINVTTTKKTVSAADFDNDPDISINVWEHEKQDKDEKFEDTDADNNEGNMTLHPNKSMSGQWKRRKGPAPAIPLLQKRSLNASMPPSIIRRELQMLEAQQRGLEKQGVRLEEIIRERCESNTPTDVVSTEPDPETDELVLQLFELVNEKNELFRRQSELMYIRRQQRLEEEYNDLEHQIRLLMARPEANKTDTDKTREEQLIQRLVEVVERRNEVITSLEMDRLREKEEDKTIRERMASHRAKRDENSSLSSLEISNKDTLKKEKKKEKKRWIKKDKNKKNDVEKISSDDSQQTLKKEKKLKKWF